MLLRDADARVPDADAHSLRILGQLHCHAAALPVVFDGVVNQIVQKLVRHAEIGGDGYMGVPQQLHRNTPLRGFFLQTVDHRLRRGVKVKAGKFPGNTLLVKLGQANNVLNHVDQAPRLLLNFPGKGPHVGVLCRAVGNQLGQGGDGREGRFQLVGHVGGKLLALALRGIPFGHVDEQHHRTVKGLPVQNGIEIHAVKPAVQPQGGFPLFSRQAGVCPLQKGRVPAKLNEAFVNRVPHTEDAQGAVVCQQHAALPVQQKQPLPHVSGDGRDGGGAAFNLRKLK
ncbi:hypothetical protein SDC9_147982 [bioreactor metagenome]|uniref:Uncharacterized protein n=1 Tax=bioreactor metagenome TaxID=1076179 RepID=A0A645EJ97_9ZZZZ